MRGHPVPDRSFIQAAGRALAGCVARLCDIVTGATGLPAYDQYLAHLRTHHPDENPMSRAAFFRAEQSARWEGVRRCC